MLPIQKRKKRIPITKGRAEGFSELKIIELPKPTKLNLKEELAVLMWPHQLRKVELAQLHGLPLEDIYVDPTNGIELYKNHDTGGWVHDPELRGW